MKKIMIIGSPGAGKSTFARALQKKLGLPLYHLDLLWHKPDRTTVSREDFDARLCEILQKDAWIIDGNYSRTVALRLRYADAVFLFDLPTEVCLEGVKARIGKRREDLPWIEEALDPAFEQYIKDFRSEQLPRILELLKNAHTSCKLAVFHSRNDAEAYLQDIEI